METRIYQRESIQQAAEQLKKGELVAFPTETVFGLGAIASSEIAVSKVFEAKGRPKDNPLIVHVHSIEQVNDYVLEISPLARQLMEAFWPGPLTIIFPMKSEVLAPSVTPGKETVAIRMPNHPEALALIETVGIPLVGPSANTSGKPSPTAVDHVYHDFNGKIAGILAPVEPLLPVGVESTVVLPLEHQVLILRPGAITAEMIRSLAIDVQEKTASEQLANPKLLSPGVKYTHYSPKQSVEVLISQSPQDFIEYIEKSNRKVSVLADDSIIDQMKDFSIVVGTYRYGAAKDYQKATQQLYAGLRALEQSECEYILVQGFPDSEATHALMNRLTKAADKVIKH